MPVHKISIASVSAYDLIFSAIFGYFTGLILNNNMENPMYTLSTEKSCKIMFLNRNKHMNIRTCV